MATWVWVIIAVAVLVPALVVALAMRKRRTDTLRDRFGPEYDRAVQAGQGRRAAESDLRNRQKQRSQINITPLPEPARARFAEQWRELQERFVDQPSSAVMAADDLVRQVMGAEGYPVDDFAAQADLVSVDHPQVVENYRVAHGVYERAQTQRATTEDMRSALLRYRSLFDELLVSGADENSGPQSPRSTPREAETGRYGDAEDQNPRHRADQ